MEKGTTINAVSYCATLERWQAVVKQRPWLLGYNRCFVPALLRSAPRRNCNTTLAVLHVENLGTSAISEDLATSDFHIFPSLKDQLSGHKFASFNDVKTAFTSVDIAGHRILRGKNEQTSSTTELVPQY
jgi:hypothetical protein